MIANLADFMTTLFWNRRTVFPEYEALTRRLSISTSSRVKAANAHANHAVEETAIMICNVSISYMGYQ